jgi:transducin (beta)-like 1
MDIDDHPNGNGNGNGNGHAYPSPQEVERIPTPIITNGPERGTQVEKIAELTSDTTFLTLSDNSGPSNSIILHCEWNPSNPTILAAAGTEPLVRLWTISRGAASNEPNGHVNGTSPQSMDIAESEPARLTSVSAFSWSPDGAYLAVATESPEEEMGRVTIWEVNGTYLHTFTGFEAPVISLRWNPLGNLVLAVMPDNNGKGTAITVFSANSQVSPSYSLPNHGLLNAPLEIVWTGDYEFMVCGGSILWAFQCADGIISLARKYETREDHGLVNIAYDPITRLIATASESGIIDVGDHRRYIRVRPFTDQSSLDLGPAG